MLLVLGVIIVGIAVAIGINMMSSGAVEANRNAVFSDVTNLAAKAQQHFMKPTAMGGGDSDFNGFTLGTSDQSNANGTFKITATRPATLAAALAVATTAITASSDSVFIIGTGKAGTKGNDNSNPPCVLSAVGPTATLGLTLN